jgi:cyclic lactone autoinducer peptide
MAKLYADFASSAALKSWIILHQPKRSKNLPSRRNSENYPFRPPFQVEILRGVYTFNVLKPLPVRVTPDEENV